MKNKKITQERVDEVNNFLRGMDKVFKITLSFILKGKEVESRIVIGGGSYASEKIINIGVPIHVLHLPLELIYIVILTLYGHEGQHSLSSNFKEFKRYNEEEVAKLVDKGVSKRFASKYVHAVGNIIEDGRIENILVNRLPGFIPKVQYLNMFFWNLSEVSEETTNFDAYIQAMLSLSVLGIYPKNYHILNGSKVDKEIDKIKDLISDGVKARTCKDGLDICREILKIAEPFILDEYEKIRKDEEMMEALMEFLEQLQEEFGNSKEEDFNESQEHSSHISTSKKEQSKDEDGDEDSEDKDGGSETEDEDGVKASRSSTVETDDEDSEETDDGSGGKDKETEEEGEDSDSDSNSGSGSDDGESMTKDEDGDKDSAGSTTETEDEDAEESDDNSGGEGEEGNEEKESEKNKEGNDGDKKDSNKDDGEQEDQNSTALSGGLEAGGDDNKRDNSEDIEQQMKELAERLGEEGKKEIEKSNREENKKKKTPETGGISNEEANEITKAIFDDIGFNENKEKFPLNHALPRDIQVSARKFKRQIKDIFDSKSLGSIGFQERGVLDSENIFRVGMGDYNVFKTETMVNSSDHVVFILRDGSGSMSGDKDLMSINALAIIEEGIKGVVPFKAVTFNTGNVGVEHTVIKDWNDNSTKNYSYNYIQRHYARGGNIDSVSIRIATEELLRRPEKDKTLIVLSDGLPWSIRETKASIKDTRSKGVNLIGIMFGNEDFRKRCLPQYRDMYQKNIIATSVDRIPNRLVNVLKETLKQ